MKVLEDLFAVSEMNRFGADRDADAVGDHEVEVVPALPGNEHSVASTEV